MSNNRICFFFSSRRRHTRWTGDWSSDVCSSDLQVGDFWRRLHTRRRGRGRQWTRQHAMIQDMSTIRIIESELARDVHGVLEKVRQGVEVIVNKIIGLLP